MRTNHRLAAVFAALLATSLFHLRLARAENAAPLGVEIGVATLADVQARVGKATSLKETGINKYTGGKMLAGDGAGLDVGGLKEICFIFDRAGVLQGVLMTLGKDFRPTYERLRKKYKVVSQRIPFVGDSYAKLAHGKSVIILEAPHMSFEMTLNYLSQALLAAFQAQRADERQQRERDQMGKL